jgi:predicted CXXCH cytochrome family protein
MISLPRWTRNTLLFGGTAAWGMMLIGCVVANRTMLAPPFVAGASFSGDKSCEECHADQTDHFASASHAKLAFGEAGSKIGMTGCESCHGAGSLHVKSGGTKGTIVNPRQSPEACFECHLDKRGQFNLPYAHAVADGKMSCGDCHDPHTGNAIKGAGASLHSQAEACTECHTTQKGPFIFKHNAMKEGCVACHNPHGSVNQKMLNAPDSNLCLQCHATGSSPGRLMASGRDHAGNPVNGSCWVSGCHEAIHGSNTSHALRY